MNNEELLMMYKPDRFLKPVRFLCLFIIHFSFSILHSQSLDIEEAGQKIERGKFLEVYLTATQIKPMLTSESNLSETYKASVKYLDIVEQLSNKIEDANGKQLFYKMEVESYELMIAVCEQLYNQTQDDTYFQQAFELAEKNRNLLLFNILGFNQNNFSEVLKAIEGKYLSEIVLYKDSLETIKEQNFTDKKRIADLEQKRDFAEAAYEQFVKENKTQKPVTSITNIQKLQQTLAKDEAFVTYFYGRNAIYTFVITTETKSFFQIKTNKIPAEIDEMIFSVVENLHSAKETDALQNLHELYKILFQPLEKKLHNRTQLQIVADGALSVLPFDALLTKQLTNWDFNFKKLPYLIYDYQITYQHSATTFIQQKESQKTLKNPEILLFAPKFSNTKIDGKQLNELKKSKDLIQGLQTKWSGNYLENDAATLQALNTKSDILHFVTHTLVNDDSPLNSKIILSDKSLILKDLYQKELTANLAVLGSCRTGSGKYQVGVGRVGMAYGFHLAGVESLVYSLWEVDETATNRLLLAFYDNLQKGLSKDKALHQAKISYLQNANEITADPYYWAGFVLQGETNSYKFEHSIVEQRYVFAIIAIVLLLLLLFVIRKFRNVD